MPRHVRHQFNAISRRLTHPPHTQNQCTQPHLGIVQRQLPALQGGVRRRAVGQEHLAAAVGGAQAPPRVSCACGVGNDLRAAWAHRRSARQRCQGCMVAQALTTGSPARAMHRRSLLPAAAHRTWGAKQHRVGRAGAPGVKLDCAREVSHRLLVLLGSESFVALLLGDCRLNLCDCKVHEACVGCPGLCSYKECKRARAATRQLRRWQGAALCGKLLRRRRVHICNSVVPPSHQITPSPSHP